MAIKQDRGILKMYSSYKSLFKIQWKLYSIGDKPLPRAIPLDNMFTFIIVIPFGYLLARLLNPILDQPIWALALLLTAAITYMLTKFDPQGRPFVIFVYDFAMFLFSPKKRDFSFQSVPKKRKIILHWDTMVLTNKN